MQFRVEYNLILDLNVGSGWHTHDPKFDTREKAQAFLDTMERLDRNARYRIKEEAR